MTNTFADLPTGYADVVSVAGNGIEISRRIVDPLVIVSRAGNTFRCRVHGRVKTEGKERLLEAISNQHNWVPDGNVIRPLPVDTGDVLHRVLDGKDPENLSFSDVVLLDSLTDGDLDFRLDEGVLAPANLSAKRLNGKIEIPGLCAELFPYQSRGVQWMREAVEHFGGLILADEMGLGKTMQILSLLLLDPPVIDSPALIICPTTLIANWKSELSRFAPSLSVMIHRGPDRTGIYNGLKTAQVVITTYDTLVNDQSVFRGVCWNWVICDEAQALKNPDSARRSSVASLNRKYTVPVTGTPIETSLVDLWSLTDIAIPGLLRTHEEFVTRYDDYDKDAAAALVRITNTFILRRRVADVATDLPERTEIDVPLELGDTLVAEYIRIRQETIAKYPVAGAMVATGQLQLFCAHPWLQMASGEAGDWEDNVSLIRDRGHSLMTPKLQRTVELLFESFDNGRKVLVFSGFNGCAELIQEAALGYANVFWGSINGSTRQELRQEMVDAFGNHRGPGCLVLNPKAAGAGLNITAATVVIHFTLAWNPALEAQASARAHRRGQTKPVHIYRLFYEDTVERVMIDRAEWRRRMGNDALPISSRDSRDLARALEIVPQAGIDAT